MKVITLLTDFGTRDGYPGILHGVILNISPGSRIVDITHDINPQDVMSGALALERAAPYFPDGSIHLAVVDPGVGTSRRPLAARLGSHFFVGPDNGLFTLLLQKAEAAGEAVEVVHLNKTGFWLLSVSWVFHGRDIFAPCAAHLAEGIPLKDLGDVISDPVRLDFPSPSQVVGGLRGQVIHIDHFGNMATNILASQLAEFKEVDVRFGSRTVHGSVNAYGDGHPGDLVALVDSSGRLSLGVVNGSAQNYLDGKINDPVDLLYPGR